MPKFKPNIGGVVQEVEANDTEFTAMQEEATARICEQSFKKNVHFNSAVDIVKKMNTELSKIFYKGYPKNTSGAQLFDYIVDEKGKITQLKLKLWMEHFYQQHVTILKEFAGAQWTQFDREGGFMEYISDLVKTKYKIAKKDSWNPADIWLVKNLAQREREINNAIGYNLPSNSVRKLNVILRALYRRRDVVGLSLKKMSGDKIHYQEVNLYGHHFKEYKDMTYELGHVKCTLNAGRQKFPTQDTVLSIMNGGVIIATFQIKGNDTGVFSNLKFEGTSRTATGARLGKAPLGFFKKLSDKSATHYIYDDNRTQGTIWRRFPQTLADFNDPGTLFSTTYPELKTFGDMFEYVNRNMTVEFGITTKQQFNEAMKTVFAGAYAYDANNKLMQLSFLYGLSQLSKEKRDKYVTDLLFIAEKKGNKVFDFGPFGKLY